jgi:DMSO/TMAO reductase YedYZ molybdopterin-dependent catalytic subunit
MDPDAGTDLARRGALSRTGLAAGAVVGLGAGARAVDGVSEEPEGAARAGQPLNVTGDSNAVQEKRDTGRTVTSTATTAAGASSDGADEPTATAVPESTDDGETDPFGFDFSGMPARVGSLDDHYVVDINTSDPEVNTDDWSLSLAGHVDTELSLSHRELLNRDDLVSRPVTMVCISNDVGGQLIDTTTWQGIPLASLLEETGIRDGAVDVVTHAVDGYSEAIPVDVARQNRVMLAVGADGMTLTPSHGFPVRLLIPGRYGMKSTKWIDRIEVTAEEHDAYWESRGWDEKAVVNTLSYIRGIDRSGSTGESVIGGVAFAGTRGIQRVEVSVDGGDTWNGADLEPAAEPYAWRRWRYVFERDISRSYEAVVRAIDGEGTVQTREESPAHPGGSTGWHRMEI